MRSALAVEMFAAHLEAAGRSPHTVRAYVGDVRAFGQHVGCSICAEIARELTDQQVAAWAGKGRSAQTKRRRISALRTFARWAQTTGDGARGLPAHVQRQPGPVRAVLSPSELADFVRRVAAEGTLRDRALIAMLVGVGVQAHELLNLRRSDVMLVPGGAHVLVRGRRRRGLGASADLARVVAAWKAEGDRAALPDHHPLFTNYRGGRLSERSLHRILQRHEGDVPVTPRVLRNTVAQLLRGEGRELKERQRLLGHAVPWITQLHDDAVLVSPTRRTRGAR